MPAKPFFQIASTLFPHLERERGDSAPDSTTGTEIRATRQAAAWRAQIARAYAYQLSRAATEGQREALERSYQETLEAGPDFARIHKDSAFATPPVKPYNAREAQEIMRQARAIERGTYATREKGQHGGVIGKSALRVLEVMLFVLWPICRRGMFPSVAHIADKAQLSPRTVHTALSVLKLMGFVTAIRRMKRVASALGQRQEQDTNAYTLHLPKGWGAIGAALFGFVRDCKNFIAKESSFSLYGVSPANSPFSDTKSGHAYGMT